MSNGACKFSPFLEMSSTAGNEWSNCQHCVKPVRTTETQLRQYHVTKVGGARHIGEPHDHKSGGEAWAPGPNRSLRLWAWSLQLRKDKTSVMRKSMLICTLLSRTISEITAHQRSVAELWSVLIIARWHRPHLATTVSIMRRNSNSVKPPGLSNDKLILKTAIYPSC